ncbi:HelD family protein [Micromonospora zamorensis]|uniref:HelD family protein n=1 Tax=Micromonospora zamorensis TaxID=709883 RepID=UPI003696AE70
MGAKSVKVNVPEPTELTREQDYLDNAWLYREKMRETTALIPGAAANSGAAAHMRKYSQARLDQLGSSEDQIAFGRIEDGTGEALYVGRHTVFDDESEVLVVNWQAPAAIPYYEANYADPMGLRLKRSFECTGNELKSFKDMVFAQIATAVKALERGTAPAELSDTLLKDLEKNRTGEMQEIVETIQAAQFELIRADADQLLVIQGGPGTGKTAVALHRVSWLLYNERDRLTPEQVLVVGPNPTFTRYIRGVLPSLGDVDVDQRDIGKLAPSVQRGRVEPEDVTKLKGEARMAGLLARALDQRIGVPPNVATFDVQVNRRPVRIKRETLTQIVDRLRDTAGGYAARRQLLREQLLEVLRDQIGKDRKLARQTHVEALLDRLWPPLTAASFLRDLLGSRDRLIAAAGDEFTAAEAVRLQRRATDRISEESWSKGDLPLLDEAESMINDVTTQYGHIVVDEAQDLSPMQLRSIGRRSASGSMTIVGDIAQSTGPWARDDWDEVLVHLPSRQPHRVRHLRYGYRVPRQVFERAARLLPIAAPFVEPPQVVRDGPEPEVHHTEAEYRPTKVVEVATRHAGKGRFVGIVCPDSCRAAVQNALDVDEVKWSNGRDGQLGQSINLVSPTEAKGLEFDAVVVVEPEEIVAGDPRGHRMLYVALTRTTTYLDVVHVGDPLSGNFEKVAPEETEATLGAEPWADLLDSIAPEAGGRPITAIPTERRPEAVAAVPARTGSDRTSAVSAEIPAAPAPAGSAGLNSLSKRVTELLAEELAQQIRESAPEALWAPVLARVAELLNRVPAAPRDDH